MWLGRVYYIVVTYCIPYINTWDDVGNSFFLAIPLVNWSVTFLSDGLSFPFFSLSPRLAWEVEGGLGVVGGRGSPANFGQAFAWAREVGEKKDKQAKSISFTQGQPAQPKCPLCIRRLSLGVFATIITHRQTVLYAMCTVHYFAHKFVYQSFMTTNTVSIRVKDCATVWRVRAETSEAAMCNCQHSCITYMGYYNESSPCLVYEPSSGVHCTNSKSPLYRSTYK